MTTSKRRQTFICEIRSKIESSNAKPRTVMRRLNATQLIISSTLVLVAAFAACNTSSTRRQPGYPPADTATSFRIGASWATPKKSFDFNTLGQSSGDTLHLVTCSDYVYFPFGKLTDTSFSPDQFTERFCDNRVRTGHVYE